MKRDVMPAQLDAGLHGLGLRAWPLLDVDSAAARLSDLERVASDRTHEALHVLDAAEGMPPGRRPTMTASTHYHRAPFPHLPFPEVLDAFGEPKRSPALVHVLGLPYVLIWECVRGVAEAG